MVGSNTQSVMQIFTLVKDKLIQCGDIVSIIEGIDFKIELSTHLLPKK